MNISICPKACVYEKLGKSQKKEGQTQFEHYKFTEAYEEQELEIKVLEEQNRNKELN